MKTTATPIERYDALAPDSLVRGSAQACLTIRFAQLNCQACVTVCPTLAISIQHDRINIDSNCHNCGRCAAACPSGALTPLVSDADLDKVTTGGLRVECNMVPVDQLQAGTLRLPCAGALGVAQWLRLARRAGRQGITLVDRGWCKTCPAGGAEHPAAKHVSDANSLMAVTDACLTKPIDMILSPLSESLRPTSLPDPRSERTVGRRGFLRGLVGDVAQVGTSALQPPENGSPVMPDGRRRILPVARLAIVEQLRALTDARNAPLPGQLFYRISVSDHCCGNQVCAKSCPTTALRAISDDKAVGLGFDPLLCIGCGMCKDHCPEQAISLTPVSEALFTPTLQTLITRPRRQCIDCGTLFALRSSTEDQNTCPSCAKSHELGRSLFADLFRA